MNTHEAEEQLRQLVIEHNLPQTDMALFGVKCPYCGKSDRIRPLESPADLDGKLDGRVSPAYRQLWAMLLQPDDGAMGVCKFCQNLLQLGDNGSARPICP